LNRMILSLFKRWSAKVKSIIKAFVKRDEIDDKMIVKIETHIDLLGNIPVDKNKVYSSESLLVALKNKANTSRTTCLPPAEITLLRIIHAEDAVLDKNLVKPYCLSFLL